MATETWYMYSATSPPRRRPITPEPGTNPAYCHPGQLRCTRPNTPSSTTFRKSSRPTAISPSAPTTSTTKKASAPATPQILREHLHVGPLVRLHYPVPSRITLRSRLGPQSLRQRPNPEPTNLGQRYDLPFLIPHTAATTSHSQLPTNSTSRQPRVKAKGNGPGSLVRYSPSKNTSARSPICSSN